MKLVIRSFLFLFCLFTINSTVCQQNTDSTSYYYDLILRPRSSDDLIKGFDYFNNLKELHLQERDTAEVIYDLRMMIIAQNNLGLSYESEASIVEAFKIVG